MKPGFFLIFLVFAFNGIVGITYGQSDPFEKWLESQDEQDDSELIEQLQTLREHPVNLNTATLRKFQTIPWLSPILARFILRNRLRRGKYRSWSDFKNRLNLEPMTLNRMKPYLTILKSPYQIDKKITIRSRIQKQIPENQGLMTSVYPGSPWKSYQRMKLSITPDLQGGILIEKDAGEKEWHDHTVGYLKIGQSGPVQKLLAGTYQIEWGQGLVFWGPYALAKSADPILAIKKRARGIQEFLYSDENRYLTGVTSEIRTGPTWITLFYSKTALDANLNPDRTVSSCVNTGLHRSDLERMKKDQLIETIQGGRVEISRSWGILGLTGWKNHYSRSIKKENLAEYRYDFQGDQNVLLGIDYDLYYQNYNLSGEIGHSRSNGLAVITNVLFDFYKTAWVLSLRHYARDFQNSHSNGFGVGETQNEKGIYLGWFGQLTENSSMSCYFDLYQHPWRTTRIPVPSRGKDFFIEYEQHLSPSLYMVFRIRLRSKEELKSCTAFQERDYPFLRYRHQKNIRFEINIRPTKQVHLKNRIEVTQVEYPKIFGQYSCPAQHERGFLLYQGIKIQLFSSLSIRGRWTTFDTHSYDSRIYVFEHDLPGILTIRSLYNRGTRGYLLLSWKIKKWFLLTTMYGNTYRHQESFWGSGNDKIMGDQEKKIGLQCDVQF